MQFLPYITISNIFTVEICMTLILTFRMDKVQKYVSRMPMHGLLFDSNSHFYPSYRRFQEQMCMTLMLILRMGQAQM